MAIWEVMHNGSTIDVNGIASSLLVSLEVGLISDEEVKDRAGFYGSNMHTPMQPRSKTY